MSECVNCKAVGAHFYGCPNYHSPLRVWECDDYTWVLAANKEDANKVYLEYMHECHGPELAGIEVAKPEEFSEFSELDMMKYRFYPNEQNDQDRRYIHEYESEVKKDPTTPRLFAVGE